MRKGVIYSTHFSENSHRPWCKACMLDLAEHELILDINTQVLTFWHYCIIGVWFIRASSRQILFIHYGRGGESNSPVSIMSRFFFMCYTIHIILFWTKKLLSGGLIFLLKWRDIFPWSQWKCNKTSVSDFKNRPEQTWLFTDIQRRSIHQKWVSVFHCAKTCLHQRP